MTPSWNTDPLERKKLWLLIAFGLMLTVAIAVTLNNIPFIRLKSDVYLRWYATVKLFEDGRNLYDAQNGEEVDMIVYGHDYGLGSGYYYPAHLILFVGLLALLPYPIAHLVWTIAGQIFYLAGLGLLIWLVGWPRNANQAAFFVTLSVLFIPAIQHAIWGQFNTIGILSLALVYLALLRERYGWAGIFAIGLTFKPHNYALTLLFFLLWAISSRQRWRFVSSFALFGFIMWLIPAIFQPTWVQDFFVALGRYDQSIAVMSVVDNIWNPFQVVSAFFVLIGLAIFTRWRKAESGSPPFIGCLALSQAIWALVVPIVGMFHILALLPVIVLLLDCYQRCLPKFYRPAIVLLLIIYFVGLIGFVIGLLHPEWYGLHIIWSEAIYKGVLPVSVILLALPLVAPMGRQQLEIGDG